MYAFVHMYAYLFVYVYACVFVYVSHLAICAAADEAHELVLSLQSPRDAPDRADKVQVHECCWPTILFDYLILQKRREL